MTWTMQRLIGTCLAFAALGLALPEVHAQIPAGLPRPVGRGKAYFVEERGNDASDGIDKSWRSLERANRSVKPGDVVYVFPGHYEGAALKAKGTKDAPITYVSVERYKAVIDLGGFKPTAGTYGHRMQVDGAYTVFDGFAVSTGWDPAKGQDREGKSPGAPSAGIASYRSTGVVLRNNLCFDNDLWGIFTKQVTDMVIEDNTIRRSRRQHGIYHSDGSTNSVLRGNISYDNGACGLQLNQGGVAPYVNVLVEGNMFFDNNHAGGQNINLDGATDVTIRNNIFIVNRRAGIGLYKIDGDTPARDNVIVNNLFILEKGSQGGILTAEAGTNWIFNNIFWSVGNVSPFNDKGLTLSRQEVGFNASNARLPGDNNVTLTGTLEDLFENPAKKQFKLKANAAVIDKGTAAFAGKSAPETDLDGRKRPQGATVDMGPYEWQGER